MILSCLTRHSSLIFTLNSVGFENNYIAPNVDNDYLSVFLQRNDEMMNLKTIFVKNGEGNQMCLDTKKKICKWLYFTQWYCKLKHKNLYLKMPTRIGNSVQRFSTQNAERVNIESKWISNSQKQSSLCKDRMILFMTAVQGWLTITYRYITKSIWLYIRCHRLSISKQINYVC